MFLWIDGDFFNLGKCTCSEPAANIYIFLQCILETLEGSVLI